MGHLDAPAILAWFTQFDWVLTPAEYAAFGADVPDGAHLVDGFVVASGREDLAWLRRKKEMWSWRKLRRARRWARALRHVPFVRMIAIGNALGYRNCRPESDIDLVIVTAPRRVWIVRFLVTGILRILRQRPGEHATDAFCPSFFLTTEALHLESLQLPAPELEMRNWKLEIPSDPYLLFWMTQLAVLYDSAGTYDDFWKANASWVRQWLPDAHARGAHPRWAYPSSATQRSESGAWIDPIEQWCRRVQERRFSTEIRAIANRDSRVLVSDHMIKLHTNDRRAEYRDRWIAAIRA